MSATDQLTTCGPERAPIPVSQRGKHLVVDLHCHLNVAAADAFVRGQVSDMPDPMALMSPASRATNAKMFATVGRKLNGVDTRLADIDRLGVDVQAISPSTGQYYYWAPPEVGRQVARLVNDGVAEAAARHPDRLVGMGTVPLQDVGMAVAELRRCVNELGLRGVEIGSNVSGRELAEDALRPFFAAAEELGVLEFLHPLGFSHGARLAEHYLDNVIGNYQRLGGASEQVYADATEQLALGLGYEGVAGGRPECRRAKCSACRWPSRRSPGCRQAHRSRQHRQEPAPQLWSVRACPETAEHR